MNKNNNVEVFLETLKELSKDEDEKVRARIASNILANKINKTRR